jgi:hypothetical protein
MNRKNTTLALAAIVAVAMTAVGFAVPQQAFAHYGHHSHNSIDVSQNISQTNLCSNSTCLNDASNDANIHR